MDISHVPARERSAGPRSGIDVVQHPRWTFHTNAGNANFSVVLDQPNKPDELLAFLRAIDATTPELAGPSAPASGGSFDACP